MLKKRLWVKEECNVRFFYYSMQDATASTEAAIKIRMWLVHFSRQVGCMIDWWLRIRFCNSANSCMHRHRQRSDRSTRSCDRSIMGDGTPQPMGRLSLSARLVALLLLVCPGCVQVAVAYVTVGGFAWVLRRLHIPCFVYSRSHRALPPSLSFFPECSGRLGSQRWICNAFVFGYITEYRTL